MSSISRLMPSISSSDRRSMAERRLLTRARNSEASWSLAPGMMRSALAASLLAASTTARKEGAMVAVCSFAS